MQRVTTVHGGLDIAELRSLGLRPEQVLDFSSNINPLGPSQRVRTAAAEADLSAYPDRDCLALREALAERLNLGIDSLMIGNGSTELIHLLARAYLRPGNRCLIFAPTFGEYETASAICGAELHVVTAKESQGFRWPIDEVLQTIERVRPSLVFLCNPNNPTGVYVGRDVVEHIRTSVGESGLLVLDNAYAPLADDPWDPFPLLDGGNIAILGSMTKDHALAGIRLGYLAADPSVVAEVLRLQPAWSVNAVAQAVGVAALEDEEHVAAARQVVLEAKEYLYSELETAGVPVTPSAANFILAKVGDAPKIRRALLGRGIVVRDCTSFGLPEHIRIAVRTLQECARLLEALQGNIVGTGISNTPTLICLSRPSSVPFKSSMPGALCRSTDREPASQHDR